MKKKNFYFAVIIIFMIFINMTITTTSNKNHLSLSYLVSRADDPVETIDPWIDPGPIPYGVIPEEWSILSIFDFLFNL